MSASKLDALRDQLHALATARAHDRFGPLADVRRALDAYEDMLARHEEDALVQSVVVAVGLERGADTPDLVPARSALQEALTSALAWLRSEPDASVTEDIAQQPRDRSTTDEPAPTPDVRPPAVPPGAHRLATEEAPSAELTAPTEGETLGTVHESSPALEAPPADLPHDVPIPAPTAPSVERVTAEPAKPVSKSDLDQWLLELQRGTHKPAVSPQREPIMHEREIIRALLESVGEVPDLNTTVAVIDELERLDEATEERHWARWNKLQPDNLWAWLTMLVGRMRTLRDKVDSGSDLHRRHTTVIRRLPAYAATAISRRHVNGMAKDHWPAARSWADDARAALEDLKKAVTYPTPLPPAPKKPKDEKRAPDADSPLDWAYRNEVAAMRVLLFGGSPREESRKKIQEDLGIGALSWRANKKPRQLTALVESIGQGTYDIVLVNRFVSHKESTRLLEAAKAAGRPARMIDSYGVETVKQALIEVLDAAPARKTE